ncbi:NAD(P)-dependent oxidoreductase [Streptomyces sp. NPDC048282]|uniref:NAD(P)-dependent oxidoreductase n=1 Tax=Streptomyces sp. NPDC048282 TaxID=3365528 RepID=UPI0037192A58
MKIAVLGATGNIGSRFLEQALCQGHEVIAYVRRADALAPRAGLTVVQGSLDDEAALSKAFVGADAVLSCIGVPLRAKKPIDLMRRTLPVITRATRDAGIQRFVLVSAFGVGDTARKGSFLARLVYRTVVARIFKDKELAEEILPSTRLDWTTVYPVNLKDAPAAPSAAVKRLDQVAKVPGLPTLPFANAATALLDIVTTGDPSEQRLLITTETGWKPSHQAG